MLRSFLTKPEGGMPWLGLALPVWVLAGFIFAQVVVGLILSVFELTGVKFDGINNAVFQATLSAVIYVLSLFVVIGLPWIVKKFRTTARDLGLDHFPKWSHLLWAPIGFIVYIFLSYFFTAIAMLTPFYDNTSTQDVGFANLNFGFEYFVAFVTLVIIAPVAEEILFRGYLLGKLRKNLQLWVSILITSILFAIVHLNFNVGVDVFALSIVLCILRVRTNSLWPSILLHMTKNGIAFYFLFINPLLLPTLGG